MYDFIKGTVARTEKDAVVLENNGIGYRLSVPASTLSKTGGQGTEILLYTYLAVREDEISLYGFADPADRECFLLLLSVSGIGPRGALSVLSALGATDFYLAVLHGDEKKLTRVPGIGAKTAKRLLVELKDKITGLGLPASGRDKPAEGYSEALDALLALGYNSAEAQAALHGVQKPGEKLSGSELLRLALARLGAK